MIDKDELAVLTDDIDDINGGLLDDLVGVLEDIVFAAEKAEDALYDARKQLRDITRRLSS